jgi:lysozyme
MKIVFWCAAIVTCAGIYFAQDVYLQRVEKEMQEWHEIECEILKERAFEWQKKIGDNIYVPEGGKDCLTKQVHDFNKSVERAIQIIEKQEANDTEMLRDYEHKKAIEEWYRAEERRKERELFLAKYAHIINYIKAWECGVNDKACRKNHNGHFVPYTCAAGIQTIGWGHTATAGSKTFITFEEAEDLLITDLKTKFRFLNQLNIRLENFTPFQQAAIVGAMFNIGYGNFKNMRTTINLLQKGKFNEKELILAWAKERIVTVQGKPSRGLIARRNSELRLLNSRG